MFRSPAIRGGCGSATGPAIEPLPTACASAQPHNTYRELRPRHTTLRVPQCNPESTIQTFARLPQDRQLLYSSKMGLFKKKDKAAAEDKKAALTASNPYAAPPKNDPYANPPPAYSGGNDSFRQDKSPAVTGQGGPHGGRGYQASGGNYGAYGGDRYGGGAPQPQRSGGYGGMGNADPNDAEDRSALFGNAASRVQQRQQQPPPQQQQQQQQGYGGQSGVSGGYGAPGGYGSGPAYDDRQLTAEEQEEEDINATKNEIKFMYAILLQRLLLQRRCGC